MFYMFQRDLKNAGAVRQEGNLTALLSDSESLPQAERYVLTPEVEKDDLLLIVICFLLIESDFWRGAANASFKFNWCWFALSQHWHFGPALHLFCVHVESRIDSMSTHAQLAALKVSVQTQAWAVSVSPAAGVLTQQAPCCVHSGFTKWCFSMLPDQPIKNQFLVLFLHSPDAKCLIRPLSGASQVGFAPPHLHKSLAQIILSPHFAGGSICVRCSSVGIFSSRRLQRSVWIFDCECVESLPLNPFFDHFLSMRKFFELSIFEFLLLYYIGTFAGCQWD